MIFTMSGHLLATDNFIKLVFSLCSFFSLQFVMIGGLRVEWRGEVTDKGTKLRYFMVYTGR